eukprot:3754977-Amphidinium_carterae.1
MPTLAPKEPGFMQLPKTRGGTHLIDNQGSCQLSLASWDSRVFFGTRDGQAHLVVQELTSEATSSVTWLQFYAGSCYRQQPPHSQAAASER